MLPLRSSRIISTVLLLATGFGWAIGVVALCPFFALPSTDPTSKIILSCAAGTVGGVSQWLVIRNYIQLSLTRWIVACTLGICVGFAIGLWANPITPSDKWHYGETWQEALGWRDYDAKVFTVAGMSLGLAQWLTPLCHHE